MARACGGREKLLEAGLRTFHERGYHACGVQEIADAAGAPKGSFYNHFESKEAFGAEVLDRYWQLLRSRSVLSDTSLAPRVRLERHFENLVRAHVEHGFTRGCLIGNLSTELGDESRLIRDRLSSIFAAWGKILENTIREAQAAGEIKNPLDAATLASFVLQSYEGAVLRAKVDKIDSPFASFLAVTFACVLV